MSYTVERRGNAAATISLITGILGLILMPIPLFIGLILGAPLAAIAIITGIIGLLNARRGGRTGTARAVWGIALAVITYIGISAGGGVIW